MKLQNDSYDAHNLYFHARFAIFHFIYFYFISFALKNTKKKHSRYPNTSNKNVTIH